ncbi:miraculin-like [Arachis duranensis]|uniref:Miraculin-like n=1 Tax=Arachis duranensis TaxID=130453 RepID=A0A6P4DKU3_ARADU|nr:miraculin-like [Arachis duranensis]
MRSLVFLFALLFALCTHPFLGEAQGGPIMELVIDTDNNTIQAGKDYYIRPVPTSPSIICRWLPCTVGAGLALQSTTPNKTCPLNVVAERGTGQAVTFTPVNPKANREIYTNSDLNIKFDVKSNCSESTVWKLVSDASSGQRIVTTGGVIGNPGKNTVNNWFQIQKDDNDYNFYFCPKVCETCKPVCGNIGVFQDSNGSSLVAITDKPYKVRFQPVSS